MDFVFEFLAARAIPGVEVVTGTSYERAGFSLCLVPTLRSTDLRAARALLDLDADVDGIEGRLGSLWRPSLRVPGTVDRRELALRAVLGQQVSVAAARTIAGRLVEAHAVGSAMRPEVHEPLRRFPSPAVLAELDPASLPMPRARGRAFVGLAAALAGGLDPLDREGMLALPGIGPWTADYVRLRASDDRDVFLPTDLGVKHAMARLGLTAADVERMRPFRSYAVMAMWASLSAPD